MTDYLDEFSNLEYEFEENRDQVLLKNLKDMNGMAVAELLTYLHDDGYVHFGPMVADEDNGFLMLYK